MDLAFSFGDRAEARGGGGISRSLLIVLFCRSPQIHPSQRRTHLFNRMSSHKHSHSEGGQWLCHCDPPSNTHSPDNDQCGKCLDTRPQTLPYPKRPCLDDARPAAAASSDPRVLVAAAAFTSATPATSSKPEFAPLFPLVSAHTGSGAAFSPHPPFAGFVTVSADASSSSAASSAVLNPAIAASAPVLWRALTAEEQSAAQLGPLTLDQLSPAEIHAVFEFHAKSNLLVGSQSIQASLSPGDKPDTFTRRSVSPCDAVRLRARHLGVAFHSHPFLFVSC